MGKRGHSESAHEHTRLGGGVERLIGKASLVTRRPRTGLRGTLGRTLHTQSSSEVW